MDFSSVAGKVASVAGLMPQSGQALYTATKFGVIGMTFSALAPMIGLPEERLNAMLVFFLP